MPLLSGGVSVLRFLSTATLIIVVVLAILLPVAGTIGSALDPEPLYLETGACTQPCWHTIAPGSTAIADVARILKADRHVFDVTSADPPPLSGCAVEWKMSTIPYFTGCAIGRTGEAVIALELRMTNGEVTLGQLFAVFGNPVAAQLCRRLDFGPYFRLAVFAVVYFSGDVRAIAYMLRSEAWVIAPEMFVKLIRYDRPAAEPPIPFDAPRWQGFGGDRHYGRVCG